MYAAFGGKVTIDVDRKTHPFNGSSKEDRDNRDIQPIWG
jgi:ribosomal protein L31